MRFISKFKNYSLKVDGKLIEFYDNFVDVDDLMAAKMEDVSGYGAEFWRQGEHSIFSQSNIKIPGAKKFVLPIINTVCDEDNKDYNFELPELESKEENKVDIILIRFNLKEVEEKAISKVKENTDFPYKLTVFDNYKENIPLSVLWNRLIKKSKSKYICLLNSDAFVTNGWLTKLMGGFADEKVAAVGPSGDRVGGIQRNIGTEEEALKYKGKFKEVDLLSGFCMVIRKDLPFSFLPEVPFYGGEHAWEVIAKRMGYKMLWSQESFVYHLGEASAKKAGTDSELRQKGQAAYVDWLTSTTPVLFTTYNRLDYTKKAFKALIESKCGKIIVIDNASSDGTVEWLKKQESKYKDRIEVIYNKKNEGVGGAMNKFFSMTKGEEFVGKVDNDTIVPKNWMRDLLGIATWRKLDILQARHHILNSTYATFDEWKQELRQDDRCENVYRAPFVGGSGVVIRRNKVKPEINKCDWVLGGWTNYQIKHPEITKAFVDDVFIELLDMVGDNQFDFSKYPDYYVEVGRDRSSRKEATGNRFLDTNKTFADIIYKINRRFAYLRFGDGEMLLMDGDEGRAHLQWNTPQFQKEMIEAFTIDDPDYLIGVTVNTPLEDYMEKGLFAQLENNQQVLDIVNRYYNGKTFYSPIMLHYIYTFYPKLMNVFNEMLMNYRVGFVGGQHLHSMKAYLGTGEFVEVPETQAYDSIDSWYPRVVEASKNVDILLMSIGTVTNVVQKRLWKDGVDVSTIDYGSVASAITNYSGDKHTWIRMAKEKGLI